jgi:hypothetical protein
MRLADFAALDLLIQGATIGIRPSPIGIRDDSLALSVEAVPSPPLISFLPTTDQNSSISRCFIRFGTGGSATAAAAALMINKTVLGLICRTLEISRMPEAFIVMGNTSWRTAG